MKLLDVALTKFRQEPDKKTGMCFEEQYNTVFDILTEYKPEWVLFIMFDDDFDEFHHLLWTLPFYRSFHCIKKVNTFFMKEFVFCKIDDPEKSHRDLFSIKTFRYVKIPGIAPRISRKDIQTSDDDFPDLFANLMKNDQRCFVDDMPEEVRDALIFSKSKQ